MQEDVEMKTVMLVINGSKLTGRTLKSAIQKDQGASTIEINDPSIKDFERIARKYGVDYAIKKCKGDKPKYMGITAQVRQDSKSLENHAKGHNTKHTFAKQTSLVYATDKRLRARNRFASAKIMQLC